MKSKFLLLIVFSAIIFTGLIGAIFLFNIKQVSAVDYYTSGTPFVATWNTSKNATGTTNSTQIGLPLEAGGQYNFTVYWGDGNVDTITAWNQAETNHTYATEGLYTISINGSIKGFRFNNKLDKLKLINISSWGDLQVGNNASYFYGCSNMNFTGTDNLNLTDTTQFDSMFQGASSFRGNISGWNTSTITDMNNMFNGASAFNGNINSWDVSKVTSFATMFWIASSFNQNLTSWDTGNVTSMYQMFGGAYGFNSNISTWNVSKVTNMGSMFYLSPFNKDISNWDTRSVTNMNGMFQGTPFNQNISNWNISSLTALNDTFNAASSFNQDLSNWDTSNIISMKNTFKGATSFNQNLGSWNVSKVTNMTGMFSGVTLSNANYNSLLTGWASQTTNLKNNTVFNGGNSQYTSASTSARNTTLIGFHNWAITDGGYYEVSPTIMINFSTAIGNLRNDVYGADNKGEFTMSKSWLINDYELGGVHAGNYTWQRNTFLDAGFKNQRWGTNLILYFYPMRNMDFERWTNISVGNITGNIGSGATYLSVNRTGDYINGSVSASTDSLTGTYSLNLTGAGGNYMYRSISNTNTTTLITGDNYTYTIWVKGNGTGSIYFNPTGTLPNCSGGYNDTFIATNDWQLLSINCSSIVNLVSGYQIVHSIDSSYGEFLFDNSSFYVNNKKQNYIPYRSLANITDTMKWAYENGQTVYAILNSDPYSIDNSACMVSSNLSYCTGSIDYNEAYLPELIDWINQTTNNGEYLSILRIEDANEPNYYGSWYANIDTDAIAGAIEYVRRFNETIKAVKAYNSSIPVGGPVASTSALHENLITTFLSNQSWLAYPADFHEIHAYSFYEPNELAQYREINDYLIKCATYGVNCSEIVIGEWSVGGTDMKRNASRSEEWEGYWIQSYISMFNHYPTYVISQIYTWHDAHWSGVGSPYSIGNTSYGEYPIKWGMVQDPNFNNVGAGELTTAYNTSKKITHVCQGGSTISVTSTDNNKLLTLACNKSNSYGIIVLNNHSTDDLPVIINLSLANGSVPYPHNNFTNYETGEIVLVTDGIINISNLSHGDVLYLISAEGTSPTITEIQPANLTINTTKPIHFSANLTDDVGLNNATLYILNSSNYLTNSSINYIASELSVIQSWFVNLRSDLYKWWIGVWDDEFKQTTSSNYTLNVSLETTVPNIVFVSPTPTTSYLGNLPINVTASDTNEFSVISNIGLKLWLRFNGESGENFTFVKDYSGFFNNGTTLNGTVFDDINGKFGGAFDFDGVDDLIQTTNDISLNITDNITISAWVKLDTYGDYKRIVVKSTETAVYPWNMYSIGTDSAISHKLRMELSSGDNQHIVYSTSTVNLNQWYLVTGTYDGTTARLYINGVLDNSTLFKQFYNGTVVEVSNLLNGKIDKNNVPLTIGSSYYGINYFDGLIDDVLIYDRALNLNEIQAMYNATRLDITIPNLLETSYNMTAYSQDIIGNINSTSRWITLGTTPPTITINSPTGSVINVVNYWFNVTLDEEGSWCGYSINGGTNVTMTQQGVLSQFKYLANIPNGFNIVTFYCNDTYGNMATASTYITGLTPSGAGTGDVPEIPTTENEDGSSGAEELSLWDKIVAFVTEKTNEAREELIDKEITGQVIDDIPGEKTFMEKYIWLFIGLFLFMVLVFSGRKGRL